MAFTTSGCSPPCIRSGPGHGKGHGLAMPPGHSQRATGARHASHSPGGRRFSPFTGEEFQALSFSGFKSSGLVGGVNKGSGR